MPLDDSLKETLGRARVLLVDLERHLDLAAEGQDLAQVARAWVRAAQLERVLRAPLPADDVAAARADVEASAVPATDDQRPRP